MRGGERAQRGLRVSYRKSCNENRPPGPMVARFAEKELLTSSHQGPNGTAGLKRLCGRQRAAPAADLEHRYLAAVAGMARMAF